MQTSFKKRTFVLVDKSAFFVGAAGRSRTDTVSLPPDFESGASANFTTAAHGNYDNIPQKVDFDNWF